MTNTPTPPARLPKWRLPPPDDTAPLGVLRARRDVRLTIAKQDGRLGDTLAQWRNLAEAARLDRLIHDREAASSPSKPK